MANDVAVGDFLMLDGRARRVERVSVAKNRVWFGAVDGAAEDARKASVLKFKLKREEFLRVGKENGTPEEELRAAIASWEQPEASPAGACAISDLKVMETPNGPVWYLSGRLEAKVEDINAVTLEAAEYRVNTE